MSRELVIVELTKLAARLNRKIEAKTFDAYHSFLAARLDDAQFYYACQAITEADDRFPAISRILDAAKEHRHTHGGQPYIVGAGPLAECLADLDAGRAYGGGDQFRGRPGVTPQVERLVYEDAAYTVEVIPDEGITARSKRIVEKAEAELARLVAAALPPEPPAATDELPAAEDPDRPEGRAS